MTKKGIERASADIGMIFIAYNLRRLIKILGMERFREYLMGLFSKLLGLISVIKAYFGQEELSERIGQIFKEKDTKMFFSHKFVKELKCSMAF